MNLRQILLGMHPPPKKSTHTTHTIFSCSTDTWVGCKTPTKKLSGSRITKKLKIIISHHVCHSIFWEQHTTCIPTFRLTFWITSGTFKRLSSAFYKGLNLFISTLSFLFLDHSDLYPSCPLPTPSMLALLVYPEEETAYSSKTSTGL
jgi:hypothetical protein